MCDKSVCIPVLFVHTRDISWYDWSVHNMLLLLIVIVVALAFDFTNGFHDTANAVAPTIATGALKPRTAVALSSVLNLVGAFLSLKVAATIASALVAQDLVTLPVIFAGLIGAICWNVTTWYFAIPSSSSHALIGGVIGAMLVLAGGHSVLWSVLSLRSSSHRVSRRSLPWSRPV